MDEFEQAARMTETEADIATLEDIQKHLGQFALVIDALTKEEDEV